MVEFQSNSFTIDDLVPGAVFQAPYQGTNITPYTVDVKVQWVGPDRVHYTLPHSLKSGETSVSRFLEIINKLKELNNV